MTLQISCVILDTHVTSQRARRFGHVFAYIGKEGDNVMHELGNSNNYFAMPPNQHLGVARCNGVDDGQTPAVNPGTTDCTMADEQKPLSR